MSLQSECFGQLRRNRQVDNMTISMDPIYLDLDALSAATSLSPRVIHQLVAKAQFPKPRAISDRRVAWLTSEVKAWAAARPQSENLPPANCGTGRRATGRA